MPHVAPSSAPRFSRPSTPTRVRKVEQDGEHLAPTSEKFNGDEQLLGKGDDRSIGTPSSSSSPEDRSSLEAVVYQRLTEYVNNLQGHLPEDMYRLIMPQLERPLIQVALELSGGEKKRAAKMLGIHRNTLRARMRDLSIEDDPAQTKKSNR